MLLSMHTWDLVSQFVNICIVCNCISHGISILNLMLYVVFYFFAICCVVLCCGVAELSRRDDLESLAYCFLYFLTGKLPWQGLKAANRNQKYELILEKKNVEPEVLCRGLPGE